MKINMTVPAEDYVLLTTKDLGRLVDLLKKEGVFESFKALDLQARAVQCVALTQPKPFLNTRQRKCLVELVEQSIVPLYDGKRPVGQHGFNRNTLRALANKGYLEMRDIQEPGALLQGYFVTESGKTSVSGD